jgi:hypothetical protein
MATIQNTIIAKADGTGTLKVPAGTTAERPVVPSVTFSTGSPVSKPVNGLNLYYGAGNLYSTYTNLPAYLTGQGCLSTIYINQTDSGTVTLAGFSGTIRVYLLRSSSGWDPVDLTGWTLFESARSYIAAIPGTTNVYYKDFAPGTYAFDNQSAMYIYDFNVNVDSYKGLFRYNTTNGSLEVYSGTAWITVG